MTQVISKVMSDYFGLDKFKYASDVYNINYILV
jgi:hypothetical protein